MRNTVLIKGRRLLCLRMAVLMIASLSACESKDSATVSATESTDSANIVGENSEAVEVEEIDEPNNDSPQYAEGFTRLLTCAKPFSQGLTWIQYKDDEEILQTAVIDTEGNIRFTLDESAEFLSDFHEGTAFYTVANTETDVLIDSEGNEIYRTHGDENETVKEGGLLCGFSYCFLLP